MTTTVTVRSARSSDLDKIRQFILELEQVEPDKKAFTAIFLRNLEDESVFYRVAEEHGQTVGFVSCHLQHLLHHAARIGEIQEMVVTASHRNRGIGKLLLDDLMNLLRKKNIHQIEVTARLDRLKSHNFYLRENFQFTHQKFVRIL